MMLITVSKMLRAIMVTRRFLMTSLRMWLQIIKGRLRSEVIKAIN